MVVTIFILYRFQMKSLGKLTDDEKKRTYVEEKLVDDIHIL